jgi:hypothetical protein
MAENYYRDCTFRRPRLPLYQQVVGARLNSFFLPSSNEFVSPAPPVGTRFSLYHFAICPIALLSLACPGWRTDRYMRTRRYIFSRHKFASWHLRSSLIYYTPYVARNRFKTL